MVPVAVVIVSVKVDVVVSGAADVVLVVSVLVVVVDEVVSGAAVVIVVVVGVVPDG